MFTREYAELYVFYDPLTGFFWRTIRTAQRHQAGDRADFPKDSCSRVSIPGHRIRAHRLAWLLTYGEWPAQTIDHINGNPHDNRLCNLRLASTLENNFNKHRLPKRPYPRGVSWDANRKKWVAKMKYKNRTLNLGRYDSLPEAARVVYAKRQELHGAFSSEASKALAASFT